MPLQEPIVLAYDPAHDLNVHVYFPASTNPAKNGAPALVYFHGGGLFIGSAEIDGDCPNWLFDELSKKDVAIISAEHTLLSPYTGFDIIEDIKNLWTYIGTSLNTALAEKTNLRINTDRLAVAGSSSGGYVAYLSACHTLSTPAKPRAVLPIYALGGCLLGDFYLKPKDASKWPFFLVGTEQWAANWFASQPPERVVRTGPPSEENLRTVMFDWAIILGNFLDVLTGDKGLSAKLLPAALSDRAGLLPAKARALIPDCNVSSDLPPFYIIHGKADTLISIDECRHMAAKLTEVGVKAELLEVPGVDHGFDGGPGENDKDESIYKGMVKEYLVPFADSFSKVFL